MKQYEVTWIRTYSKSGTVVVDAADFESAHQLVSDQIDCLSEKINEYEFNGDELDVNEVSG